MRYYNLVIDGPYLSHRSYDAPYPLHRSDGLKVTHIHSFLNSLQSFRKKFKPTVTCVAWESHGTPSWRRKLFPDYKPSGKVDSEFIEQQEDIKKVLYLLNIPQFYSPCNEADDVIASYINKNKETSLIFTVDKDMMQLVNDKVMVFTGKEVMDVSSVRGKYNILPNQLCDMLAITGDPSDNIPGVSGYGIKKTQKILKDIEHVEAINELNPLYKHKEKILRNKKLIELNKDCKLIPYELKNSTTIEEILDKYELFKMKSVITELKNIGPKSESLDKFY